MSQKELNIHPLLAIALGGENLMERIQSNINLARQTERRFPFYDIIKLSDTEYRLNMALAGYAQEDISIVLHNQSLTIEGSVPQPENEINYMYKGLSLVPFKRTFEVMEYMEVTSASFKDGILSIELLQNVPEDKKPRTIAIS